MNKMLLVLGICLMFSVGLLMFACSSGGDKIVAGPQTNCPVMGGKIDRSQYVDYQGKRIYFCCADCPKTFRADPEKYMKKMRDQGVVPEDTPVSHSQHGP